MHVSDLPPCPDPFLTNLPAAYVNVPAAPPGVQLICFLDAAHMNDLHNRQLVLLSLFLLEEVAFYQHFNQNGYYGTRTQTWYTWDVMDHCVKYNGVLEWLQK